MANYNTFIVVDCNSRKSILTTSSARKAKKLLRKGYRIDIWNNNEKTATVYERSRAIMIPYIEIERDYIRKKQEFATMRNKNKKAWSLSG